MAGRCPECRAHVVEVWPVHGDVYCSVCLDSAPVPCLIRPCHHLICKDHAHRLNMTVVDHDQNMTVVPQQRRLELSRMTVVPQQRRLELSRSGTVAVDFRLFDNGCTIDVEADGWGPDEPSPSLWYINFVNLAGDVAFHWASRRGHVVTNTKRETTGWMNEDIHSPSPYPADSAVRWRTRFSRRGFGWNVFVNGREFFFRDRVNEPIVGIKVSRNIRHVFRLFVQ
ncbi:unnamed protein product [Prorocentrum cordatum]|uniref:Galectin n=1 Tax=Prorocentrum cordatum TaxID=2364126 RepID=A0ABN9UZN5_9DINO|nr:unnamed protein product [Polarella glacialis]